MYAIEDIKRFGYQDNQSYLKIVGLIKCTCLYRNNTTGHTDSIIFPEHFENYAYPLLHYMACNTRLESKVRMIGSQQGSHVLLNSIPINSPL
jgi:hypothetical protein